MTEILIVVAAIVLLILAVAATVAIRDRRRGRGDADAGALHRSEQQARAGGDAGHGTAAGSAMTSSYINGGGAA